MRTMFLAVCVFVGGAAFAQPTVMIDDMTGTEVMEAVRQGKTTVIIYVGGLHENTYSAETTQYVGPQFDAVSINKHNLVAEYQARRIAEELGNALAYYPLPYTPARSHLDPRTVGGTVALSDETFAAVLRDMAGSAIVSGFTDVVFIGEDGAGQRIMKEVAEELDREWSSKNIDVYFFPSTPTPINGPVTTRKDGRDSGGLPRERDRRLHQRDDRRVRNPLSQEGGCAHRENLAGHCAACVDRTGQDLE